MTPTARTLAELRGRGFTADVVERRVFRQVTKDFLGIIDVIAVKAGEPPLGIQATSASNAAARVKKAAAEPRLLAWLAAGGRFEVWAWGKRDGRWQVRRIELTGADLAPRDLTPRPPRRRRKDKGLFDGLAAAGRTGTAVDAALLRQRFGRRDLAIAQTAGDGQELGTGGTGPPPGAAVAFDGQGELDIVLVKVRTDRGDHQAVGAVLFCSHG